MLTVFSFQQGLCELHHGSLFKEPRACGWINNRRPQDAPDLPTLASPTSPSHLSHTPAGISTAELLGPLPQTWPFFPTSFVLSSILPRTLMLPFSAGQLSPFRAQPGHDLIQEAHFRTPDLTGYTFLIFYLPRLVPPCPGTFQSASTLTKHLVCSWDP